MSFSLTTAGATLQELAANLLAAARQFSTTEPTPDKAETAPPKSTPRVRKTTETPAATTSGTPPSSETPGPTGSDASTSTSSPDATPAPTLDQVRAALQPLLRDEDLGGEVSKLIVAQGATKLSLVEPSKYQALLDSAQPLIAKLAAKATS